VEEAEIKAALTGIKLLAEQGRQHVIVELDCAAVAKGLQSSMTNRSKHWALHDEAKKNTSDALCGLQNGSG
jgi:ribonuclease HI